MLILVQFGKFLVISSILPSSPKELSSCSSEQSVFLALLDYRRPLSAPPPPPRSVRTEPPYTAAGASEAPRYSALLAGWCVLLSSKAGAAFGLRLGWLALFSPKAAEADQAGFLPALTRARDATAAVLLVSAPAHCTCWPCLAWRHPCSSLWRCLSWHSQAEGKAAAV